MARKTETAKPAKSERTRTRIINTCLDLMKEKRWDKISVKELCEKASITRGTFYQYFDDIYNLIEFVETRLLDELSGEYAKLSYVSYASIPTERFVERFDCRPPEAFYVWFRFVKAHKKAVYALLDRKNGDPYFVKKLKRVMEEYINRTMDSDGHPNDVLRSHFVGLFSEMHLLSAQSWIEGDEDALSEEEILNLLNTMRVGSCFLGFKSRSDPGFNKS